MVLCDRKSEYPEKTPTVCQARGFTPAPSRPILLDRVMKAVIGNYLMRNYGNFLCLHSRAFLFPSDLQLELDYWAETGEFDEDELHEVIISP